MVPSAALKCNIIGPEETFSTVPRKDKTVQGMNQPPKKGIVGLLGASSHGYNIKVFGTREDPGGEPGGI